MRDTVREIVVKTESGETMRMLTNDVNTPHAGDRQSLQTPMADRTVLPLDEADTQDQNFVGRSENAVRIEIAVALIAFVLLRALE